MQPTRPNAERRTQNASNAERVERRLQAYRLAAIAGMPVFGAAAMAFPLTRALEVRRASGGER